MTPVSTRRPPSARNSFPSQHRPASEAVSSARAAVRPTEVPPFRHSTVWSCPDYAELGIIGATSPPSRQAVWASSSSSLDSGNSCSAPTFKPLVDRRPGERLVRPERHAPPRCLLPVVFVAREPAVDRLPEEVRQAELGVRSLASVGQVRPDPGSLQCHWPSNRPRAGSLRPRPNASNRACSVPQGIAHRIVPRRCISRERTCRTA